MYLQSIVAFTKRTQLQLVFSEQENSRPQYLTTCKLSFYIHINLFKSFLKKLELRFYLNIRKVMRITENIDCRKIILKEMQNGT